MRALPHLLIVLLLPFGALAQDMVVAPYLQSATPTSIWICWESSSGDESVVEWGLTEDLGEETEGGARAGFAASRHHEVELTDLAPATRYFYRVRTRDLVSEIYHLRTPPADDSEAPTRLLAVSDMQRDLGHPDIYRQIIEDGVVPTVRDQFGEDLADALSMALVPGDLVDNGLFYNQWADQFFTPSAQLLPYVPLYPVPGNHEFNSQFYFDYFRLPENGTPGFDEHWWYVDHSNLRVIGLDSNFGFQIDVQLEWLDGVLADACADDDVDFVFAELHHPFHSELWPAGNTDYTGGVIERLEHFSTDCGKPSVHFYGHTHGYSRGQSRDHQHLMVNVATAGGSIDRWGEYRQIDYPEHTVSQDEYGFVLVEVMAGDDPLFRVQRVSRGQPDAVRDNALTDEVIIRAVNTPPAAPSAPAPLGDQVNPACFTVALDRFVDDDADGHQATQWQVAADCESFDDPLIDRWRQSEDWFDGENRQAGDDLLDEVFEGLAADTGYCWRARVRDTGLVWSAWSEPAPFSTAENLGVALPLLNPGAEEGTDHWRVEEGIFESVDDGECAGGDAFAGRRHFAVGGVCDSSALGVASQRIDVSEYAAAIDAGERGVRFGGQLRDWNGSDRPDFWLRFLDGDGAVIAETDAVGHQTSDWTEVVDHAAVVPGTRAVELVLRGRRNAGTDNDSYFDDLFVTLTAGAVACDEAPVGPPIEPDAGVPDAALPDAGSPDAAPVEPDAGPVEPDAAQVEPDAAQVEPDSAPVEPDAGPVELDAARAEPDAGQAELDAAPVEPDAASVEPDSALVEPDSAKPVDLGAADGGVPPEADDSETGGPAADGCQAAPSPVGWLWALALLFTRRRRP